MQTVDEFDEKSIKFHLEVQNSGSHSLHRILLTLALDYQLRLISDIFGHLGEPFEYGI